MASSDIPELSREDAQQRVLDAIYAALDEVDDGLLSEPVPRAPETALIGDGGLESLVLVTFAVTLEERLQGFGWVVSVMDVLAQDPPTCTTGQLAVRICDAVDDRAR